MGDLSVWRVPSLPVLGLTGHAEGRWSSRPSPNRDKLAPAGGFNMNPESGVLLTGEKIGMVLGTVVAGIIYLALVALVANSFL